VTRVEETGFEPVSKETPKMVSTCLGHKFSYLSENICFIFKVGLWLVKQQVSYPHNGLSHTPDTLKVVITLSRISDRPYEFTFVSEVKFVSGSPSLTRLPLHQQYQNDLL